MSVSSSGGQVALPSFQKGQDIHSGDEVALPFGTRKVSCHGRVQRARAYGLEVHAVLLSQTPRGGGGPFFFALAKCLAMAEYSGLVLTVWRFMLSYCHKLHKFGGGGCGGDVVGMWALLNCERYGKCGRSSWEWEDGPSHCVQCRLEQTNPYTPTPTRPHAHAHTRAQDKDCVSLCVALVGR